MAQGGTVELEQKSAPRLAEQRRHFTFCIVSGVWMECVVVENKKLRHVGPCHGHFTLKGGEILLYSK